MADSANRHKDFNMVVSLVKTQIRGERRFNADGIGHCIPALTSLIDKYDWIPQRSAAIPVSDPPLMVSTGKPLSRISPRNSQLEYREQGTHSPVGAYSRAQQQESKPIPVAARAAPMPTSVQPMAHRLDEDDERVMCDYCGRGFAADRVEKHKQVCNKHPDKIAKAAKRGQLDMTAKRVGDLIEDKGKPRGKARR